MICHILIFLSIFFISCDTSNNKKEDILRKDLIKTVSDKVTNIGQYEQIDKSDFENATLFIVIADTNLSYFFIDDKMFELSTQLNMPIDTIGRYFNSKKNLIVLTDSEVDEIFSGEYYPRRFPSDNLSLEYLNFYQNKAGEKTIALVAGIYETEKSADSALTILKQTEEKAFKITASIYVGCMH